MELTQADKNLARVSESEYLGVRNDINTGFNIPKS
jgi:hypothetical protein